MGEEVAIGEPMDLAGLEEVLVSKEEKQFEVSKTVELKRLELKLGRPQEQQIQDTLGLLMAL